MKKMIYICDRCKEEVKWVYEMPRLIVEGLNINVYESKVELCEKCARNCIEIMEKYQRGEL